MEKRVNKLIRDVENCLKVSDTLDGKIRLQEQLDFLMYIKTGKKPTGISGICHLI
jgi:hypothetical protein